MSGLGYVPVEGYLQNQAVSQPWPVDHRLPTDPRPQAILFLFTYKSLWIHMHPNFWPQKNPSAKIITPSKETDREEKAFLVLCFSLFTASDTVRSGGMSGAAAAFWGP